jgi:hypothetical protein
MLIQNEIALAGGVLQLVRENECIFEMRTLEVEQ